MSGSGEWVRRTGRVALGLAFGAGTALIGALLLCGGGIAVGVVYLFPRFRERVVRVVGSWVRWWTVVERRRLGLLGGVDTEDVPAASAVRYLLWRVPVGLLGAAVLFLIAFGLVAGGYELSRILVEARTVGMQIFLLCYLFGFGVVLLYVAITGFFGVAEWDRRIARQHLVSSAEEVLRRRVARLATTRAEVVDAVNDERRRIERDLHDGVQQRIVALGLLIGRARRADDPDRVAELLGLASEESHRALDDLREVAWRVYPTALRVEGLRPAVESVLGRATVAARLDFAVSGRLPLALETAVYFVVSEAVTNVVKHARATQLDIHIGQSDDALRVVIRDDGQGGASEDGGGLSGLARRIAALDGNFTVDSPQGGPTVIRAELPCG